jgi:hypothetical protein
MEGHEEQGGEQPGGECGMEKLEQQGAEQIDIEGNQQMDMDNDDGEHETGDGTASGSRHKSRRRSHIVMPPLVLDSEDGKAVIRSTGDG